MSIGTWSRLHPPGGVSLLPFRPPGVAVLLELIFLHWRGPTRFVSFALARESAKPVGRHARAVGQPKMAALEEEFTLSTGVLSAGAEGFLGVEQSDKADQFLVTDSGRTVVLYKVRARGAAGRCLASVRSREREA